VRALEQRIAQQQAQPRHGLAGGGLGHAQLLGRAADAAVAVHGVKDAQQVEVQVLDIHLVNIS